jgi:phosphodiesterase/alkaline phosphatase D-like protein
MESVTATPTGLSPDTTYYYRVIAANASGTTIGAALRFSTGPGGAPNVTTGVATAITGTTQARGDGGCARSQTAFAFEYGTTVSFGLLSAIDNAGDANGTQQITLPLTGLAPGTTYLYRIVATNASGTTTTGVVRSFSTAGGG